MTEIEKFDAWCKKLANEAGLSYPLIFKHHLRQIKNKWNAFDDEVAVNINEVMLALLNHNITNLLIEFVPLLESKMLTGKLISIRLRMFINCGIAFNMQHRLGDSEQMYLRALESVPCLRERNDTEANNLIGSIHYNYARLKVSCGENDVNQLLETAIDGFTKGDYKPGLASCYGLQAVLLPAEAYKERIELFLKAADLNKQTNQMNDYAMRIANVGVEFVNKGDYKKGLEYLNHALDINLQNCSAHHLAVNYLMLAEAVFKSGDVAKAKGFCEIAEKEFQKANIVAYNADVERLKNNIANALKQPTSK